MELTRKSGTNNKINDAEEQHRAGLNRGSNNNHSEKQLTGVKMEVPAT